MDSMGIFGSETAERIARLYAMTLAAFRDPGAAVRFMMRPHPELNGRAPFDATLTEAGGREVEEIIDRGSAWSSGLTPARRAYRIVLDR